MVPVANVSFHDTVLPFERHHVVEECRAKLPDVINDMEKEMDAYITEYRWEVNLDLT
jgi:hypothetical protein